MVQGSLTRGPQFVRYFGPVLDALRDLGGSGRPTEVGEWIASRLKLSESEISQVTKNGQSRYSNQVAWARFYLAKANLLESSSRGVWSLTEKGLASYQSNESAVRLYREVRLQFSGANSGTNAGVAPPETGLDDLPMGPTPAVRSFRRTSPSPIGLAAPRKAQNGDRELVVGYGHRVKDVLPKGQTVKAVYKVSPSMTAGDVLAQMQARGYSQVPVVEGKAVLGVFSYRSFAAGVMRLKDNRVPANLQVDEFIEDIPFALLSDDVDKIIDNLDKYDAVVVETQVRLRGIVATIDVFRYFYEVTGPFALLQEIEISVRRLLRTCANDKEIGEMAQTVLHRVYEGRGMEVPKSLDDMTFDDYIGLIRDGRCWSKFQSTFGNDRDLAREKLEEIRDLRNIVFHFKRNVTTSDRRKLEQHRNWLKSKIRAAEARQKGRTRAR